MIHELKILPNYYDDVVSGRKTFEVRHNDRDFQVGDFLALNKYDEDIGYTGECCIVEVVYILDRKVRINAKNCVIMAIRPCDLGTSEQRALFTTHDFYKVPAYSRPAESEV